MSRNDVIYDFSRRGNQPYKNLPDEEDYTYREPFHGAGRRRNTARGEQGDDRQPDERPGLAPGQEFDAERAYTHRAGYDRARNMNEGVDWTGGCGKAQPRPGHQDGSGRSSERQ